MNKAWLLLTLFHFCEGIGVLTLFCLCVNHTRSTKSCGTCGSTSGYGPHVARPRWMEDNTMANYSTKSGYFRTLLILNDFELQPATTVSDFVKLDHPWILEAIVSPNDVTTIRNRWFGCDHHVRNFYCDTEVQRPSSQQRYAHPTWEVLTAEFYNHKKSTKTHSFAKFSRHIFLHGLVDMPHCLLVQICPNSRIPCQNSSPKRCLVTPASRMQRVIIILQTCTEKRPLILC